MLSSRFVKEIHARLAIRYGSSWSSKWAGISVQAIEADWADQLGGMHPENIRKALASLPPDFPPTAPAFKALGVILYADAPPMALPAPSDPAVAEMALKSMSTVGKPTPAEFMLKLDADVRAGNANPARIRHHRIATENGYYGSGVSSVDGDFVPIAKDLWPVGMHLPSAGQRLPSKRLAEDFEVI